MTDSVPSKDLTLQAGVIQCPDCEGIGKHDPNCSHVVVTPATNEWGIAEAFKTLEKLTEGSLAAVGAMRFLRGHIERLQRQVEELSIHAEKWVKRALDSAPEPAAEWLPIETAPKDRDVLGWFPYHATPADGGSVWVMRWNDDRYAKTPRPYFEASGWVWGKTDQRAKQPTHWMAVPSRPAQPPRDGQ